MKAKIGTLLFAAVLGLGLLLPACNSNHGNQTAGRDFAISVTNLSANQAFSPLAVVLHGPSYQAMTEGKMASPALEMLAEGGDNGPLLAAAAGDQAVSLTASGAAGLAPGATDILSLKATAEGNLRLSVLAMLIHTNDGFMALNGVDIAQLAVGDELNFYARVFDAGTEANSELMTEIPGPVAGGEGFNAARNDRDFVAIHAGVISHDDGLATSVLDVSHRFDNPVARIIVRRTR